VDEGVVMQIKQAGILGAGTMGNGIAHVLRVRATAYIGDVDKICGQRAGDDCEEPGSRGAKNKISIQDKAATLDALRRCGRAKLAECDFIVEAATEKLRSSHRFFAISMPPAGRSDTGIEYLFDFHHQLGALTNVQTKLSECTSSILCR